MSGRGKSGRGLSSEDRRLWDQVRRGVKPLAGRDSRRLEMPSPEQGSDSPTDLETALQETRPARPAAATALSYRPPVSRPAAGPAPGLPPLDDKTMRKLRKGRLAIDSRIDLHGMSQAGAHAALRRFLARSAAEGSRIVLVITGKGRTGEGVLRRQVPLWLRETGLREIVGGYRSAHVSHGGDGALYVRLRRAGGRQ